MFNVFAVNVSTVKLVNVSGYVIIIGELNTICPLNIVCPLKAVCPSNVACPLKLADPITFIELKLLRTVIVVFGVPRVLGKSVCEVRFIKLL
jgi:hypothetical protein